MNLNSKFVLIIILYQCLLIYCNDTHNHTTQKDHNQQKTKVIEASGFIIYRRHVVYDVLEYLLLFSTHEDFYYSPPKGNRKKNESSMETALRVTEEETGIKKEDLDIDNTFQESIKYTSKSTGFPKKVTYFLARFIGEDKPFKLKFERLTCKWMPEEVALKKVEFSEMKKLISKCEKYLNKKYAQEIL